MFGCPECGESDEIYATQQETVAVRVLEWKENGELYEADYTGGELLDSTVLHFECGGCGEQFEEPARLT